MRAEMLVAERSSKARTRADRNSLWRRPEKREEVNGISVNVWIKIVNAMSDSEQGRAGGESRGETMERSLVAVRDAHTANVLDRKSKNYL